MDISQVTFFADCPYCEHREKFNTGLCDEKWTGAFFRAMVICPPEKGGCDQRYIVELELEKRVRTGTINFSEEASDHDTARTD